MATVIPTISPLPPPPQSNDPTNFDARADVFVQGLKTLSDELAPFRTAANQLADEAEADAAAAAAAASTAINAPGSASTSATSNTIGLGAKNFATQTGKAWAVGQVINIARTSNPATSRMQAVVNSYNSGTGALAVTVIAGTILGGGGTHTDWTITLSGSAVPMMLVDWAYSEQTGYNILSATIPVTGTPQSTQGTQLHSATLTPKSTTNRIRVQFQCQFASSAGTSDFGTAAVFINGSTTPIATVTNNVTINGAIGHLIIDFQYVPGVTTAQTITVRVGCSSGSFYLGGNGFSAVNGGLNRSTLRLEELAA